jgi:hypothetical protein
LAGGAFQCRTSSPRSRRAGTEITVSTMPARGCGMPSCLAAVTAHASVGALPLWERGSERTARWAWAWSSCAAHAGSRSTFSTMTAVAGLASSGAHKDSQASTSPGAGAAAEMIRLPG